MYCYFLYTDFKKVVLRLTIYLFIIHYEKNIVFQKSQARSGKYTGERKLL